MAHSLASIESHEVGVLDRHGAKNLRSTASCPNYCYLLYGPVVLVISLIFGRYYNSFYVCFPYRSYRDDNNYYCY